MKKLLLAGVITACSFAAAAADSVGGVGAKLSTLGVGVEYTMPVHEQVDLGLGLNYFKYSHDFSEDKVDYTADVKLFTFGPTAYFYPWQNGFNINAGLFYNGNKGNLDIRPNKSLAGSEFTFNNVTYSVDDIENTNGDVTFNKVAPYLGVGYKSGDRSQNGLAFDANLGVMFHGTPSVSLNARCSDKLKNAPTLPDGSNACDELLRNVKAEQQTLKDKVDDFKVYPVVSAGFIYRF